jgi:hypothetical protein
VFIAKLQEWLVQGFAEFIKTQTDKILAATEDPADGVTLRFTVENPPGLKELGQSFIDKGPSSTAVAETISKGGPPTVRVEIVPGHQCD